jgi:hypothetical protein
MLIRVMHNIIDSLFQISVAILITFLQRYLLELATIEEDMRWFKRTIVYDTWKSAHWYRGVEVVHQYRAWKLLQYAERN